MSRIQDARGIHELYSPRGRVRSFPSADFRFLVHVAANVARLFASVHKAGFIIGDVNHGNILVRNDGTVAAIDCDFFQVGDGSRFPCRVGIELFTPPELLGRNLGDVRRTPNHDAFGLAVLIFHLLFMGRHPFAGRYLGLGEMPIEKAIAECRFAYSRDGTRTKMSPPPFTLPLGAATPVISEYFERAFHPDGRRGGRPTPEDWMRTLEALKASLRDCPSVAWHQYPPSVRTCPWCEIERASGAKLYGGVARASSAPIADLEALWARYLKIADPAPRPLPREEDWTPPADRARSARRWRRLLALATSLASLGAADVIATVNPGCSLGAACRRRPTRGDADAQASDPRRKNAPSSRLRSREPKQHGTPLLRTGGPRPRPWISRASGGQSWRSRPSSMPLASSARLGCKPSRSRFPKRSNGSHISRSSVSRTRASSISAPRASPCCGPGAWRPRPRLMTKRWAASLGSAAT